MFSVNMIRCEKSIKESIDNLSELSEISKVSGVRVNPQKETVEICMAVLLPGNNSNAHQ